MALVEGTCESCGRTFVDDIPPPDICDACMEEEDFAAAAGGMRIVARAQVDSAEGEAVLVVRKGFGAGLSIVVGGPPDITPESVAVLLRDVARALEHDGWSEVLS